MGPPLASIIESKWFGGDFGLGIGLGPPISSSIVVEVTGSVGNRARLTANVCKCLWSRSKNKKVYILNTY